MDEIQYDHEHELEANYLYPTDAEVLSIHSDDGSLVLQVAVPCPECGDALELYGTVSKIEESELELPLEDVEETYD